MSTFSNRPVKIDRNNKINQIHVAQTHTHKIQTNKKVRKKTSEWSLNWNDDPSEITLLWSSAK